MTVADAVDVSGGAVRGTGGAYLGIPYGRAPVGELRWRAPEPAEPWSGVLEATRPGPPPPQPERPISKFAHGATPPGSEDCLTLNVWTPRTGEGPWPVLVWAIGGGWTIGWTGSGVYDGAALAETAQCVVVTFTYRLGSLGWLCHPDLGGGNWGLLDHVAALAWVRDNVASFGGDPARVTMGGQSAGAANVAGLLVCPAAEGLFTRAILHSPPLPEAGNDPEHGARWAEDLAAAAGVAGVPALRGVQAARIVELHEGLLREPPWQGTRGAAWPALDPGTLPVAPLDRPDARLDVPVIIGSTRDEATFLFRTGGREASDDVIERVTRDLFTAPTQRWARERAAAGGEVHLFRIDHPSHDERLGALHTIDVPLLFGTFRTSAVGRNYVLDDPATRAVSEAMQADWSRFLHGGDPGWGDAEIHVLGTGDS